MGAIARVDWKAEEAMRIWLSLDSGLADIDMRHGEDKAELVSPVSILQATSDEFPEGTGNQKTTLELTLVYHRDDSDPAQIQETWALINDRLLSRTLAADLTEMIPDWHVFGVVRDRAATHDYHDKDHTSIKVATITLFCMGKDLGA